MDKQDKCAQIIQLIRSGVPTSKIHELTGHPLALIKEVKSKEIAEEARAAQEKERRHWDARNRSKAERKHKEWLAKRGIKVPSAPSVPTAPPGVAQGVTEQAQQGSGQEQGNTEA